MLTHDDRAAITEVVLARLGPIRTMLASCPHSADRVIASGGTLRALARLAMGLHRPAVAASTSSIQVNQVELPAGQLHVLADRLAGLDLEARLALPGIQQRRAPLLPVGAAVLSVLVDQLGLGGLVVSEWGLREGAVIDALSLRAERH